MKRIVCRGFVVLLLSLVSIPVLAADKSDVAGRTQRRSHDYQPGVRFLHCANHLRLGSERMTPHDLQHRVGGLRRHDRDQLAFVCDIERIKSQQALGPKALVTALGIVLRLPGQVKM